MRMGAASLAVLALFTMGAAFQAKKPPPKTIKVIMEQTHKGADNPASEVRNGRGTEADVRTLLEAYQAMAGLKPPAGDAGSWKAKTGAVIAAIQDVLDKKPGAVGRVHATTECSRCHDVHRVGGNK